MYHKRDNEIKILSLYLGNYNQELYLREISRLSKLPLKTTQTYLDILLKTSVLTSRIRGKHKYFKLNLSNPLAKFHLLNAEIHRTLTFLEKYPMCRAFVNELDTFAIVFGSFAKFKANKNSDFDLLTLTKNELPTHLLPYQLHRIEITKETLAKPSETKNKLLKEIEENHIVLNDYSFYVNAMWCKYAKQA